MTPNPLQILLNKIKLEDTTTLLSFINKVNTDKLEGSRISDVLSAIPQQHLNTLTPNQLELIRSMRFRGGDYIYFYTYNKDVSPFVDMFNNLRRIYNLFNNLQGIPKEDTIFLSEYHKSKWKQANPSRTNTKGTQFTFKMDMFSFQLFKNSIKKEFLRTEAKNFVLKVNQAFNDSSQDTAATKIRNKFYAIILDNTKVHTKAMINSLQVTNLALANDTYYPAEEDEAVVVSLGYSGNPLASFNTPDSMTTYSTDLTLVTHNNGVDGTRASNRMVAAASVLLTLHARTANTAYKLAADRMLSNLDAVTVNDVLKRTSAIEQLRNILKESL